ncbi:MAG TPA: hypothetical protein VN179_05205 [Solirubrobacterales bacterium]|nr:hypothetical protein [Solirubrobacterales bacterium]
MARKTAEGVEAAAVAAAIAQFEAEFAAAPAPERPQTPAWQRAALMEGVGAKETIEELRGGSKWLS